MTQPTNLTEITLPTVGSPSKESAAEAMQSTTDVAGQSNVDQSSVGQSNVGQYWRSLEELGGTDSFQEFVHREFPQAASEFPEGVSRRRWLQLMSASFALAGATGCRWETEKIAPMVNRPDGYIPGKPQYYATNVSWAGGPKHLLVTSYDGRPIKVEGNPEHPSCMGSSDGFTQAATLSLYDPDRAKTPLLRDGRESFAKEWSDFDAYFANRIDALSSAEGKGGAGLAILTPPLDSYTLFDALDKVTAKFPAAKFYSHTPISNENELAGTELAFGQPMRTHYRLEEASVIAAFDADILGSGPDSLKVARDYAEKRDPDGEMNRLYSIESQFTTTGAAADHRLPAKSSAIGAMLSSLRDQVKTLVESDSHDHGDKIEGEPTPEQFIEVLADDLAHSPGISVVIVGAGQPANVHAIAHEINSLLGNLGKTVLFTEEPAPAVEVGSIAELTDSISKGSVDTLLILDGNPAYDAPAKVAFATALKEVPNAIRLGVYDDETSRLCRWSLPETHPFEQWGDVIAWDGSVGVTQPLINPLVGGRSKLELLSLLAGDTEMEPRQLVAASMEKRGGSLDDASWNKLLHDGVAVDADGKSFTSAEPVEVTLATQGLTISAPNADDLEVVFTLSSSTLDGRLANNAWLQETPDFLTKLTWDNAALVSPQTADDLNLEQGKIAELTVGETTVKAPVYVMPGQARGSIGIALGYGRTAAGRVGGLIDAAGKAAEGLYADGIKALWLPAPAEPVGFDAYPLREASNTGFAGDVKIKGTTESFLLATTQDHHAIDQGGLEAIGKRTGELIRGGSQEKYLKDKDFAKHMAHDVQAHYSDGTHGSTKPLWDLPQYPAKGPDAVNKWGMSIDLTKCIGCNACSVACQAENNVPVVGKDQVHRGREMHWIRIDRYFKGVAKPEDPSDPVNFINPEVAHQPIACQQCETAPCEEVCPVAATLHDDEGLNNMVYNRCIGTRYCANNCPYKVRRFNYFRYTKKLYEATNELMQLVMNPEVTVRSRGVMEKCTYCQQRISTARITAKNEARAIRDGDVVSACQQACPTKAIEFGDLNDPNSRVSLKREKRSYGILTELMTIPRTEFLAKIRNPHPRLARPEIEAHGHGGHDGHAEGHGEGHEEGHGEEGHDDHSDHADDKA